MVIERSLSPHSLTLWSASCSPTCDGCLHACKTFQEASSRHPSLVSPYNAKLSRSKHPSFFFFFLASLRISLILSVSSRLAHEQTIIQGSPDLSHGCPFILGVLGPPWPPPLTAELGACMYLSDRISITSSRQEPLVPLLSEIQC